MRKRGMNATKLSLLKVAERVIKDCMLHSITKEKRKAMSISAKSYMRDIFKTL